MKAWTCLAMLALICFAAAVDAQGCKSYERQHFECDDKAGKCCQKGLICNPKSLSMNKKPTCTIPPSQTASTLPGNANKPQTPQTLPGSASKPQTATPLRLKML